jgi:phosphoribosylanthranilate isomerase
MVKVKLCGQTRLEDCRISVEAGADFLGVVYDVASSPRSLTEEAAAPIFAHFAARTFLLTCNRPVDEAFVAAVERLNPYALQLTGDESYAEVGRAREATARPVFKSIHLAPAGEGGAAAERLVAEMNRYREAGVDGFVLDTATKGMYGGTGMVNDWELAARLVAAVDAPIFIAGGIDPENVAEAAALPGVYGVDLASGIEAGRKGVKSHDKISRLFAALGRGGIDRP